MAIARVKTWSSGEVLTASDLNTEFNNILNNPVSLWSPAGSAIDFDGQTITFDAAGATTVVSSAAVSWNFTSGAKTGTPATTGSIANFSAATFTDSATAGSGTATAYVAHALQRPTLAAANASVTTTDAAALYIANNVAAGTNQTLTNSWAVWVDAGNVRFDDDIHWLSGQTFAQRGILAHANSGIRTYTFPDADGTVALTTTVIPLSIIDAAGDFIVGTAADTVAKLPATASVAAHATTCDVWTARETVLTGTAVTFTDIADAPYAGAVAWVYMNAAHVWTDGAVFDVQGGANYTAAIGDWVRINAVTVSTFDVTIFKANGAAVAGGVIAQVVSTQSGAVATGTTPIPADDTIPQNTEGDQYMTLAITPTNASSKLIIEISAMFASDTAGAAGTITGALFQDATAGALAASGFYMDNVSAVVEVNFKHTMTAGTTSATTFKLRAGPATGATLTFNGAAGTRRYGGVSASTMVITEVLP